jgi:hypothetical protein
MSTIDETDPSTSTIAAAWASSPLGDPISGPTELWETVDHVEAAAPAAKPKSIARHAAVVAALACGIGASAALGMAVFDSAQPTVTMPPVSVSGGGAPVASQAVPPKEAVSTPDHAPRPKSVVSAPQSAPSANGAASSDNGPGSADVGSQLASAPGNTTVNVDMPIPPLPDPDPLPEPPKPEPANPEKPKPASDPPALQPKLPTQLTPLPPKPKP